MAKTTYKPRPPMSLEEATVRLINACGGPKAVAGLPGCTVTAGMLFKYTNDEPEDRGKTIPAKLIAYLENYCGKRFVTSWLAGHSHAVVVALPIADEIDLPRFVAAMGKEESEVFAVVGQALEDGVVTVAEAKKIAKELRDVMEVGAAALMMLDRLIEDGGQ